MTISQFDAAQDIRLVGASWSLAMLQGAPVMPDSTITARFNADGAVSGSSGCNRYRAAYQIDGASMTIGAAAGTLMACPPPLMEQERAYLSALQATVAFEINADTLTLKDQAGAAVARFVAEPQDLADTNWDVTGYNNGRQAVVSLLAGTAITARFSPDGRLAGNAGCNDYAGPYDLGEETIAVGPLRTTRRFCQDPEGLMEQEHLYLAALQTAATYRVEGHTLELRTADGALAVKFRRAAGEPATDQGSRAEAAAPAGQACVTGLVTFAEPTTLPEDVVVQVRINDISRMDAPAVVMGEQIVSSPGSTPIPYCVGYNPDDIQPHHTYSMQARIEDSTGALLYISNTITPVITRSAPSDGVEIAVIRVGR
jgi:heat shock protein HslJ